MIPPGHGLPLPPLGTVDSVIFTRGNKLFELTNHLGNVLATLSDKRYGVSTDDSTVKYFIPDLVSAHDYYPFGSLMPNRAYAASGAGTYRFGFNGQERSDEIKGDGNSYTAEFWEYDPRIGRRWNIDPVTLVNSLAGKSLQISPFATMFNDPILKSDVKGDSASDIIIKGKNNSSLTLKTSAVNITLNTKIDFGSNNTIYDLSHIAF